MIEASGTAGGWAGQRIALTIGPVAHGGHCVARHQGRVVFVRHCLPGETVLAEVTEDRGGSFCRADAVQVLEPSPLRVEPPCRYAQPGGCGGCDFQHVTLAGQRELKAAVVTEQLQRLAGLEREVEVLGLPVPSDSGFSSGLGWRRRIRFAVAPDGRLGLHAHRSDRVVPVAICPIGASGVGDAEALAERWPGRTAVEIAAGDDGAVAVTGLRAAPARRRPGSRPARRRDDRPRLVTEQVSGPAELGYRVAGREFRIEPTGFWQTHPAAAAAFTGSVLAASGLQPGERALDLYAGAGLFTAALAVAVGPGGAVFGLEADAAAVAAAAANLADLAHAEVRRGAVTAEAVARAADELGARPAVVVLDPPRTGVGRHVMQAVLAVTGRVVVYVACDPAALARDVRTALDEGWKLTDLTAYDAFPMTHHVECVAVLGRTDPVV